jgi:pimeloyl-ACP methyl ester carboxylesterase
VGSLARFILADMEPYLMDGRLAEITVPVDLVWGESDGLIPLEYARKLEQELPRARLTTISGCGHIPQLECPERLQEVLQAVLGREP